MLKYWVAGVAVAVLLGFLSRRGERADRRSRQIRPANTPPTPADVDALLQAGQKIAAIKLYREMHGVDLKEAKDAIDARARELGR
ncbi:MAG TPA: ribosomal protein L7/L12 [Chloroflexota bacterium]|jgi:ribosomal protein L7/L12